MQHTNINNQTDRKWYVMGYENRYGPYSVKQMICLYYRGILKSRHICESTQGESATVQYIFNEFRKKNQ